jgi:choline transport protein
VTGLSNTTFGTVEKKPKADDTIDLSVLAIVATG